MRHAHKSAPMLRKLVGIGTAICIAGLAAGCDTGILNRGSAPGTESRSAGFPSLPTLRPGWLKKAKTEEEIENTPVNVLYNEGLAQLDSGSYRSAVIKFEQVERLHPYSDLARKSLILITYSHYRIGQYDETIAAGERYLTLYPGSEDAAYAQYLIAESYFKQVPTIERDQKLAAKALREMTELVEKYPQSEYAADAREKIIIARDQLAGKEMEVGRYYQNRGSYLAALNRYRNVVTNYQTTRHVEEALHRLTETYMALGIVNEAQTAAAVLGHNFPDSEWYQDSYRLLQKGGLQPQENRSSWISQLFRDAIGAS
ncbi:MAG: outer membrane protein assembly factor BamD [Flavobacteriaceae bacterium]